MSATAVRSLLFASLLGCGCDAAVVPRPAPDLALTDVTGAKVTLAGYRGNVVVVAFMSTLCTHCQAVSKDLETMYVDMGKRGLRVVGAAFNEEANVRAFANQFGLVYPLGAVPRSTVEQFMGIAPGARIGTPQLAVVDRKGMIRAQTDREGSPVLQQPDVLRELVNSLLRSAR